MLKKIRILIDPGHGAGEKFNRGGLLFNEGDQNFLVAHLLKKELEKYEGFEVFITRQKITDNPETEDRPKMYENIDLFFSVHTNAAGSTASGVEIYSSYKNKSVKLGLELVKVTSSVLGITNRGVRYAYENSAGKKAFQIYTGKLLTGIDYFGVLRNSKAPQSYLIENCFHTNIKDSRLYLERLNELVKEQARVIAEYYEKKEKVLEIKPKSIPVFAEKNGFNYYIKNGVKQTGFQTLSGYTYYFREKTGTQAFGWQFIEGYWRYFRKITGTQAFGWQFISGSWYYFRSKTGTRVNGFQFINGKWRYFADDGKYLGDATISYRKNPN